VTTSPGSDAAGSVSAGGAPITGSVAEFVVTTALADIPSSVRELGQNSILDGLGVALAGSRSEAATLIRRYVSGQRLAGSGATVLGTALLVQAELAALANGVAIHADDYDDIQLATADDRVYGLLTHPTAPVLAAVLAVAETRGLSGSSLLRSYLIGIEVACKVAEAIEPRHYEDGFHSTGTCGTIGAAAAIASLLELSYQQTLHALGVASSQAAGLRVSFGTMTKSLHAGRAAQNAITAAELALSGFTAAEQALEGSCGFFQAAGGGFDPSAISGKLGRPWTFAEPGIAIKPYPCASLTHPAVRAVIGLVQEHQLDPGSIHRVLIGTNSQTPSALRYSRPVTPLQAKFSMEYCVAVAIVCGHVGLAEFQANTIVRPDVSSLLERIECQIDPRAEARGLNRTTTFIKLELADSTVIEAREDFPLGTPSHQRAAHEVNTKFAQCARYCGLDDAQALAVISQVRRLEMIDDVRDLSAILSQPFSLEATE
jgi:2-methylcitrate dehydratase PrpD